MSDQSPEQIVAELITLAEAERIAWKVCTAAYHDPPGWDNAAGAKVIQDELAAALLRLPLAAQDAERCSGCGGPHQFDTSVPSVAWNEVIRGRGKADYLCTTCIVREFAVCGRSFTATLYGDGFSGLPIEVGINGAVAHDAHETQEVNNRLRSILFILTALNDRDAHEAPNLSEWDAAWQTAREVLDAACRTKELAAAEKELAASPPALVSYMTAETSEERDAAFLRTYAARVLDRTASSWEIPNTVATTLQDIANRIESRQKAG